MYPKVSNNVIYIFGQPVTVTLILTIENSKLIDNMLKCTIF